MASESYSATHEKINSLLDRGCLHDAFSLLRKSLSSLSDPATSDKLNRLEETYKYMIHYLVEGYADSGRDEMHSSLTDNAHTINDMVLRSHILKDSPDVYYSTKRLEDVRKTTLRSALAAYRDAYGKSILAKDSDKNQEFKKRHDKTLSDVFNYVWTMFGSPEEDYRMLTEAVADVGMPFEFKAQMVSALMLGSLKYYDRNAFSSLLDIYEADYNQRLSARALVAILLVVSANSDRIGKDRKLKNRLSLWQDSIIFYRRLREVFMAVIRTRDTERISSKMQNEVIPELMKLRPEIISRLKNMSSESDMEMLDTNPEWEDLLNKNGLGEKLKELTDMQLEGGDVMMVAFSNLKSFPFFNNVPNWFVPFSAEHSEIAGLADDFKGFADLLDMEGVMCDSDKFSFAFSLRHMPEAQRKMATDRMNEQMSQIKEMMADRKLRSSVPEFDSEVTRYVRDIYRFFKLFKKKADFKDPFAHPIDFRSLPFLSDVLSDMEIVNLVGEFYFKRGYYAEALPMLKLMDREHSEDNLLWERIGYCHNALNDIDEAIIWYKKAELLNPESQWLMKKLALCYKILGKYTDAAEYYAKALAADPDNYSLLMSAGNCILEKGDISGAIANYYHADYVRPDRASTWRALAWAELLKGDKEKSLSLYEKLISNGKTNANDFLNAGHAAFLFGNLKKAVDYYTKCATTEGNGIEKLEEGIRNDMEVIKKLGGNEQEANLLLEKVKYSINA